MENDIIDLLGLMEELIEENTIMIQTIFSYTTNSPKLSKQLKKN